MKGKKNRGNLHIKAEIKALKKHRFVQKIKKSLRPAHRNLLAGERKLNSRGGGGMNKLHNIYPWFFSRKNVWVSANPDS